MRDDVKAVIRIAGSREKAIESLLNFIGDCYQRCGALVLGKDGLEQADVTDLLDRLSRPDDFLHESMDA